MLFETLKMSACDDAELLLEKRYEYDVILINYGGSIIGEDYAKWTEALYRKEDLFLLQVCGSMPDDIDLDDYIYASWSTFLMKNTDDTKYVRAFRTTEVNSVEFLSNKEVKKWISLKLNKLEAKFFIRELGL